MAVEFAARYPELVNRVILLCPSGMGDKEQLPIIGGVMGRDAHAMVRSVFHKPRRLTARCSGITSRDSSIAGGRRDS